MTKLSSKLKAALLLSNAGLNRPPFDDATKYVTCDVCGRHITFIFFRSVTTHLDLCNCCKNAVDEGRNRTVSGQNGAKFDFSQERLFFMDVAPRNVKWATGEDVETDDDEVTGNVAKRLKKAVVVVKDASPKKAVKPKMTDKRKPKNVKPVAPRKNAKKAVEEHAPTVRKAKTVAKAVGRANKVLQPGKPDDSEDKLVLLSQREPTQESNGAAPATSANATTTSDDALPANVSQSAAAEIGKKRPREKPIADKRDELKLLEEMSSNPVSALLVNLTSRLSPNVNGNIDVRPPQDLLVSDGKTPATIVAEDTSTSWSNAFVGLARCKVVLAVRIVPTFESEGVWISMLCEDDYSVNLHCWQATATAGRLNPPVIRHSTNVGKQGTIRSFDWFPLPLHRTENNTLGVCTLLRDQIVVTVAVPRVLPFEQKSYMLELCGATALKRDNVPPYEPVELRWYTSAKSISETFLFVMCKCSTLMVYEPVPQLTSGKLMLIAKSVVSVRDQAISTGVPSVVGYPPFSVCKDANGEVFVAVSRGRAVELHACPSFTTRLYIATTETVTALCATRKGFLVSYDDKSIRSHTFKGEEERVSESLAYTTTLIEETEEKSSAIMNSAGQCLILIKRSGSIEVKPSLQLTRAPAESPMGRRALTLTSDFDPTSSNENLKPTGVCKVAHHPCKAGKFKNFSVAFFPDGAWVLFPVTF